MTTVNVYLTFNGNCQEAFDFYRSIFGGEYASISTFAEMPPIDNMPIPEEMKDKIMHVTLPIGGETSLMGSDTGGDWGANFQAGNNFSISVGLKDREEASRIFKALAEGGKITMPIGDTFWNAYFGSLTDRFGINWMVNCTLPAEN